MVLRKRRNKGPTAKRTRGREQLIRVKSRLDPESLAKKGSGLSALEKPGKIYLNNTNQIYAISRKGKENTGTLRETFFINMLSAMHNVSLPHQGDFLIDNKYTFEIGGKNKSFRQIKDIDNSFLALDDMETGIGNKIPLWLFGFLY